MPTDHVIPPPTWMGKDTPTSSNWPTSRSLGMLSKAESPMTAANRNRKYSSTQNGSRPLDSSRSLRRSRSFSHSISKRRVTRDMVGWAMLASARPRRRFSPTLTANWPPWDSTQARRDTMTLSSERSHWPPPGITANTTTLTVTAPKTWQSSRFIDTSVRTCKPNRTQKKAARLASPRRKDITRTARDSKTTYNSWHSTPITASSTTSTHASKKRTQIQTCTLIKWTTPMDT